MEQNSFIPILWLPQRNIRIICAGKVADVRSAVRHGAAPIERMAVELEAMEHDGLVAEVHAIRLHLSGREIEVLQLVSEGRSNKEIGDALGLSALTVKSHLARIARKLGTITYRSAEEWRVRFGRNSLSPTGRKAVAQALKRAPEGFGPMFDVESYLEAQAERFVRIFDPNCYLYLSRALDCFDLTDHGEPVAVMKRAGLNAALVIGVESDLLFTIREQADIAAMLDGAGVPTTFARLPSIEGHDAFLVDYPRFDAAIRGFLDA